MLCRSRVRSTITVDERFGASCLQGMNGFSHVEVHFVFNNFAGYREPQPDRSHRSTVVGSFADRGPRWSQAHRVACCMIESVTGRELAAVGLDAVICTPVIDLQPVMREFLRTDLHQAE
ncbi:MULTISPECIES: TrmO family methyltransferase domain-containing protein [Aeromicrobium]|uniref:TrmO family methyltransferase domain-containing protein n=1 Tax=Aeromicrobium TaxID=2040 RepID=UPI00257D80CB|nr:MULTISPECIES: TrmO family methyltransferase [Aeromicrobium]